MFTPYELRIIEKYLNQPTEGISKRMANDYTSYCKDQILHEEYLLDSYIEKQKELQKEKDELATKMNQFSFNVDNILTESLQEDISKDVDEFLKSRREDVLLDEPKATEAKTALHLYTLTKKKYAEWRNLALQMKRVKTRLKLAEETITKQKGVIARMYARYKEICNEGIF